MSATLELPLPSLSEGCFASIPATTDEALFEATGVRIAFMQRKGGVSDGLYESLNIGGYVEDDRDRVAANRALTAQAFDTVAESCIIPHQVHGTDVYCVDGKATWRSQAHDELEVDGVAISVPEVGALLSFADCVPVIVVAPSATFVVIHAGWRGVASEIVVEGLRALASLDGCPFDDRFCAQCNIYIGPYIHQECFEVANDTHALFVNSFGKECAFDDTHIDLGAALRVSLMRQGVDPARIADIDACTCCNQDTYFSFRESGGVCGRHGAFAVRHKGVL